MTILWVELLPKLSALLTTLAVETEDPLWLEQGAEWAPLAHKFVSPDAAVQIDLRISATSDGEYETRVVSGRDVFTGYRQFVLNVQCKGYQPDFARWALVYAERIRTNLQRNGTRDRLNDEMGVVLFEFGTVLDVPGVEDGQALTVANLDVFGYAGFSDDPETAPVAPFFTSITVRSKLVGPYVDGDGNPTPLTTPPNFIADIPPPPEV